MTGLAGYSFGHAAEKIVAKKYEQNGYVVAERCWRGEAGEIDLICQKHNAFVFVEVKASQTLERAAARLGPAQMQRQLIAAQEYLGSRNISLDREMRLDVALCDRTGHVQILENAFGNF